MNNPNPFAESLTFKAAIYMLYATLAIVILVIGKPFLVPLAWSLVITLASIRMLDKIEARTHLSRSIIILGFILVVLSVILLIFYFFFIEIRAVIGHLPDLSNLVHVKLHSITEMAKDTGIHVPDHIDKASISEVVSGHGDLVIGFLSEFGKNIGNIFLIGFYLFFMLYFRDVARKFIQMRYQSEEKIEEINDEVNKSLDIVNNYVYGLLLLTVITIAMNYVVFLIFGLDYALFFAVLVGLLNIIPYVGNPIAMIVTFLYSILTMDTLMMPILIQVGLFITNFIQDNVLKPWLLGDKLHINAFMVFLSVVVGGYIWGFSGMLLFVPAVGIIKIMLEKSENTRPFAVFFSQLSPVEEKIIEEKILEETNEELGLKK